MDIQKLEIELTKFTQWLIENRPDYKGSLILDMNDYLARAKCLIEDSNCTIPDVINQVCGYCGTEPTYLKFRWCEKCLKEHKII